MTTDLGHAGYSDHEHAQLFAAPSRPPSASRFLSRKSDHRHGRCGLVATVADDESGGKLGVIASPAHPAAASECS